MKDQGHYIRKLIEKLADKEETGLSWKGFEKMAETLGLDPRYLKYTLYEGDQSTTPRQSNLDIIAERVGSKNFFAFCKELDAATSPAAGSSVDPVLQSMVGNFYNYVRMNHEEANLLRSPVRISLDDGNIFYHQKGGRLEFNGRVQKHEGCLFVLMESNEGKSFYHVYRIGTRTAPEVLQGIFSGVSTDFKPIGGRAVLIRTQEQFEDLTPEILDINKMLKSKSEEDQSLANYFQHREENNLSIKGSSTFNLRDLRDR